MDGGIKKRFFIVIYIIQMFISLKYYLNNMKGYVEGKSKNELLHGMVGIAKPLSEIHEQLKMGIVVRCTEDLEKALGSLENSMTNNAKSSDNLAKKVMWLNFILTGATVTGTILAIYKMFFYI